MVLVPRLAERTAWLNDQLRILLVDRRPLFQAALGELMLGACPAASIERMSDSRRALAIVSMQPIDLVLCEVRAQPVGGPELAARVSTLGVKTRVVLLSDTEDQRLLIESLGCGAAGFFTKDALPEEFLEGVDAVLAGHLVVGQSLVHLALTRLREGPRNRENQLDLLSAAERSILTMVGQAQSTRAIAASRGITQKTVRNHLANIYRKLEVRNRSEAILWSARAGLTELSPDR